MNKEKTEFTLPEEVTLSTQSDPRDLVVISIPKMGKGTILGAFTREKNAIVFDLERDGYEFIDARKISIYNEDGISFLDAFKNYIKYKNLLLSNKGKYTYLVIDGLSDLDKLSDYGGTRLYMDSIVGKKFNREIKNGVAVNTYDHGHPEWKSVITLPDGAGYQWTRKWFLDQIEIFRQISPYRIYAAHTTDKLIKEDGVDKVVGSEVALTGQLKRIFASSVTSLAKLTADGNERWLNFEVQNDSIIAGSRHPNLKGKILISKALDDGKVETYWNNIYKN